jgi:hypothetical protein
MSQESLPATDAENNSTTSLTETMYAITITGLQLRNVFCYPKFYWYTIPALRAAQSVHTSTNQFPLPNGDDGQIKDTLMTLTVWESRQAALRYVYHSPEHIAAMKQTKNLSNSVRTYHYEGTTIPTWEEAKEFWLQHSKEYKSTKTMDTVNVESHEPPVIDTLK